MIKSFQFPKLRTFWKKIEVSDRNSKSLSQPNPWCPSPCQFTQSGDVVNFCLPTWSPSSISWPAVDWTQRRCIWLATTLLEDWSFLSLFIPPALSWPTTTWHPYQGGYIYQKKHHITSRILSSVSDTLRIEFYAKAGKSCNFLFTKNI